MSGIDYSKWDKMDFSDSECDSSDDDRDNDFPAVTRLDEPSSVTYSQNGISVKPQVAVEIPSRQDGAEKNSSKSPPEQSTTMPIPIQSSKTKSGIDIITKNGGRFIDPVTSKDVVYWSQDRNEVVVSILFDHKSIESRNIRLDVRGALNYGDRHSAVGEDKGNLKISVVEAGGGNKDTLPLEIFEGRLAYSIHYAEGEDDLDWEIMTTSEGSKLIRVTLLKSVPMQGLTIWWNRPFLHFPMIDVVSDIEGRGPSLGDTIGSGSDNKKSQHEEWKKTWDEAHDSFRDKVKNRVKEVIHLPEEDS
uniref:CS domain-containing protein n=1 Tax=Chaetoceros debilis TaxID=122233 RepID=A0A7S3PZ41_9STRA